jgi:hypothetical protein
LEVMIRLRQAALLLLALAGCRTSAPHGIEAAAINTALAGVVAGVSVTHGGCVAMCTNGWVCNPRSGFCEAAPEFRCVGGDLKSGLCANRPDDLSTGQPGAPGTGTLPANLGISPATGGTPPPPAEASPRPP